MTGVLLENGVEIRYRGSATLHGSENATLAGRSDGVAGMLWEALGGAGWVGEFASPRMTVAIRVGVPRAPTPDPVAVADEPRRRHEGGWLDEDGIAWQQSVGPLSGRFAGPGFRVLENELAPLERGLGDALLRAAAAQAGWLSGAPSGVVELPKVRLAVSVARRNPRWEDPDAQPLTLSPQDYQAQCSGTLDDRELLVRALEVAARLGDPDPVRVSHARGTRFDVTSTTGSKVFSDTPACIFAMQGNFRWNHSRPARPGRQLTETDISYRFLTVVIDAKSGKSMDIGASNQARDLTALGHVISDRP
jgi:hypothetical protein